MDGAQHRVEILREQVWKDSLATELLLAQLGSKLASTYSHRLLDKERQSVRSNGALWACHAQVRR